MIKRRLSILAIMVVAVLTSSLAQAKPAWGPHVGPGGKKKPLGNKPSGENDLVDGDINFDALSPKDCASYMCMAETESATAFIEAGCPGSFVVWQAGFSTENVDEMEMDEVLVESASYEGAVGVTTGTLLALALASGVFASGVGFVAGYKSSPSFAYMRIPSLV